MSTRDGLVVRFALDPSSRTSTHEVSTQLVVDEQVDCEGNGEEPPEWREGLHVQALVEAGAVAEEECERHFECHREDQDVVSANYEAPH